MAWLGGLGALKSRDLPFCKTKIKKKKISQLKARSTPSNTATDAVTGRPPVVKGRPPVVKGRPLVVIAGLTGNLLGQRPPHTPSLRA